MPPEIAADVQDAADILALIGRDKPDLERKVDKDNIRATIRGAIIKSWKEAGLGFDPLSELKIQIKQWRYDGSVCVDARIRSDTPTRDRYGYRTYPYAHCEVSASWKDGGWDHPMRTNFHSSSVRTGIERHYFVLAMTMLEMFGRSWDDAYRVCTEEGVITTRRTT